MIRDAEAAGGAVSDPDLTGTSQFLSLLHEDIRPSSRIRTIAEERYADETVAVYGKKAAYEIQMKVSPVEFEVQYIKDDAKETRRDHHADHKAKTLAKQVLA